MTTNSPILSDEEIIALFNAGKLLETLDEDHDRVRVDALRDRLVALHNQDQIDLLGLTETPEFAAFTGYFYYPLQQVFCDAIPLLDGSVERVVAAVERLVDKAGKDGAAGLPYSAFRLWLQKDSSRALSIISSANAGTAYRASFLSSALEALGDFQIAASFLGYTDNRRHAAVSALGSMRIKSPDDAQARQEILRDIVGSDPDPGTRHTAVFSAFSVLENASQLALDWVPQIVKAVAHAPTHHTKVALLQHLWRKTEYFDKASIADVLALVSGGDLSHAGVINMLGVTLGHLVETEYRPLALDCLTALLAPEENPVTLDQFDNIEHHLLQLDRSELFALAVRWLATGNPRLCRAVADVLSAPGEPSPFDDNLARFGLTGSQQVVLCHKAIAYLFIHPVVAASFVVAALRAKDGAVSNDLMELLAEPILTNYQGEVRDYLRSVKRCDAAYREVRRALKFNDAYMKDAGIEEPIKELAPTTYQKSIARIRRMDEHRAIHKSAESQSTLANLFHRQTLLYGRKSLIYMHDSDKPPVTMEMQSFSHSIEVSQMSIIDPVGLDDLLRIFSHSTSR